MKHKDKLRIARNLQSKDELKEKGYSLFTSKGWEDRKLLIAQRVERNNQHGNQA